MSCTTGPATIFNTLSVKQGASLQVLGQVQNADGTAFDISGLTITGSFRDQYGRFVANMVVTPTTVTGLFYILQPTDGWPLGLLKADLKFVFAAVTMKTDSFQLLVLESETT